MPQKKTITIDVDAKDGIDKVKQLEKGVKGVDTSSKGAKKGLGGMTGMTQKLGVAFKALGVGLIVAAFMKLKDIFSGNIETARKFERITAQLSAAFDVIRDRAEEFIKSLIKMKNPIKAFKEAFTGTTAEIKEEVKAMGELTDRLQEVRDREREMLSVRAKANKIIAESRLLAEDETKTMQERLVALKAAVAEEKRVADLELQIQEDKVKALQESIDLGKSSEEDMIALEQEKAKFIELQTASVLKQKRVVTEIVTFEKQIATEQKKNADAKQKQKDKEAAQAEKDKELKEKELETLRVAGLNQEQLEIDQATKKYEKLKALAEKYGLDTTEITERYNEQLLEIDKKYMSDEEKGRIPLLKRANELELEITDDMNNKQIAQLIKTKEDELAIEKAKEEASKVLLQQGGRKVLNMVAKMSGEGTKAAKAAAVAGIIIDTAKGISGAIAAGAGIPFPANLGAIASGIASVMAGIANAKATLSKAKGGDGGGGSVGGGGSSGGGSPVMSAGGGMGANSLVPNMEAVTQGAEGEEGSVRSYVVEQDISNKQALQQELETQATL